MKLYPSRDRTVKLPAPASACPICGGPIALPVEVLHLKDLTGERTAAGRLVLEVVVHLACGPRLHAAVAWFDGVGDHAIPIVADAPSGEGASRW